MHINYKTLKTLSVKTKSGQVLGHVRDFILQTDGQSILQYEVGGLFSKKYLISREQVLSIDSEKMVVEDGVVGVEIGLGLSGEEGKKMDMEPVVMREEIGN